MRHIPLVTDTFAVMTAKMILQKTGRCQNSPASLYRCERKDEQTRSDEAEKPHWE